MILSQKKKLKNSNPFFFILIIHVQKLSAEICLQLFLARIVDIHYGWEYFIKWNDIKKHAPLVLSYIVPIITLTIFLIQYY